METEQKAKSVEGNVSDVRLEYNAVRNGSRIDGIGTQVSMLSHTY